MKQPEKNPLCSLPPPPEMLSRYAPASENGARSGGGAGGALRGGGCHSGGPWGCPGDTPGAAAAGCHFPQQHGVAMTQGEVSLEIPSAAAPSHCS